MDDLRTLLTLAEGSGRVEWKRSCLWPHEVDRLKVQSVLMRLANANRLTGGIIELGREDDGRRVGLVDKNLQPVTRQQLATSEQAIVQIAGRLDPPMQIRWQVHHNNDLETIAILVPGRPFGGWYQDETGVAKTGSASHPVVARQQLLRSWALEANVQTTRSAMLRQEYILSHDGLSAGMLAGTEPLPAEWEDRRRRELGWDRDD